MLSITYRPDSVALETASYKPPNCSSVKIEVPPITENQITVSTVGTINTPNKNCLMVRPFEILAIKRNVPRCQYCLPYVSASD